MNQDSLSLQSGSRRKRQFFLATAMLIASACSLFSSNLLAQAPLKIGVLTDMSGPYANYTGKGSVEAARMAVEDFGGTVLGRPIEVAFADHQNKPDIGSSIARRWYENEGVSAILDIPVSSIGLAVQEIARQNRKAVLFSASAASTITGASCSPYGIQWTFDTYSLTKGVAESTVKDGAKKWFFITSDNAAGHALEKDLTRFVAAAGGAVVGSVRHAVGISDFSSFLLQAQGSKADVIALANGGEDTINSIKQANEFGITTAGQRLAVLVMAVTQMHSIGLKQLQGTVLTTAFVWNRNQQSREWSERFFKRVNAMPAETQAGVYSSLTHYLKAVKAAGTLDTDAVLKKMRELPVDDFFSKGGRVREDGMMVHDMYLVQVKTQAESKGPWDYQKVLRTIPASEAFRPLSESDCPLVKKN